MCVFTSAADPTCVVYGGGGPRADSAPGTMSGAPRDPFYSSPFGPFYRRHAPSATQPQYRIHELNKRLQSRTEDCDIQWWDAFCSEFFEDDATLTLSFCLEDGPKTYTIGRALIPRFFSTLYEGGVYELFFELKHTKESFNSSTITVDCHQCTMITQHGKPTFTKVCTEGRLILVFTFDDLMRIKTWHFTISHYNELIPRSMLAVHNLVDLVDWYFAALKSGPREENIISMLITSIQEAAAQDPGALEQLSKNISRVGLTNLTLNYLRLCMILEPMQELMSRHKTYGLSPRDCLKTCLFHQWQRMTTPPVGPSPNFKTEIFQSSSKKSEAAKPTAKRRRRRNSAGSASNSGTGNSKKRSPANSFSLPTQDVMVVGEPSLMGAELGDVDERLITRLENEQYDPAGGLRDDGRHDYTNSQAHGNSNRDGEPTAVAMQRSE